MAANANTDDALVLSVFIGESCVCEAEIYCNSPNEPGECTYFTIKRGLNAALLINDPFSLKYEAELRPRGNPVSESPEQRKS